MRRLALVTAVLALLLPVAPVAAHPLPHETVRVVNLRPAPGEVVAAGAVQVAAVVTADTEVGAVVMVVDGRELPATVQDGSHAVVDAVADLEPGSHTVGMVVDGQVLRTWEFTVAPATERLAGAERVGTASAISRALYPESATAGGAVLVRADDFPDALAGGPLAVAVDGPLLLTGTAGLDAGTGAELSRVLPAGATVHLLGGANALGERVAADVRTLGFVPRRLAADDRYGTAAAVARLLLETATAGLPETGTAGVPETGTAGVPETGTVVVASGVAFADALAVSSPAGRNGWPILLTAPDALPAATRALLQEGFRDLVLVGGPNAVSEAVAVELGQLGGVVRRVSGPSRAETALAIADQLVGPSATVALANAERFPDALAGGRHAAALGAPLLLTPAGALAAPAAAGMAGRQPARVVVYGGAAVVPEPLLAEVRLAVAQAGAPRAVTVDPAAGSALLSLDQVVVEFDRDVDLATASVYATIGGLEVQGRLAAGDFPRILVFTAEQLPTTLAAGERYELRVVVRAGDAAGTAHLDLRMVYAEPPRTLTRSDEGPEVADLQRRLTDAGYWVGGADGQFGPLTNQAVIALQKVHGLTRDGVYGPQTRAVLEAGPARPAPRSAEGLVAEIDEARQVLLVVRDGAVEWIFNTSTGTEQPYTYEGREYLADTPNGRFRITREIDGLRQSELGLLYRPKYFHPDGIAIHGASSVPAYPASHGCARVSLPAMDFLWTRLPVGSGVWVY